MELQGSSLHSRERNHPDIKKTHADNAFNSITMSTEQIQPSEPALPDLGDMTLEEDPEESPRIISTWASPNPQLSSPFFDGRIPGEIRNAMEESWVEFKTTVDLDDGRVEVGT